MVTVSLKGAEFFAYHGYYAEEQLLGGKFLIDLDVYFIPDDHFGNDELEGTVNYEHLYIICCEEMKKPQKLIETVAKNILKLVKEACPNAEQIELVIKKVHPPFRGNVEYSAVAITYNK